MDACDIAIGYAEDVVSGKIPAGKYVRLACQRFLDDLARDWQYEFDRERASRAVKFIELMPHTKGKWAAKKELLRLEPWQKFIECNLFGWVHKETRLRRFRTSFELIPRKNGKSARAAGRGNYMFCADGEAGSEVYSGATSEKQAHEVFRPAWVMASKLPELRERFGIDQSGNPKNPGTMYVLDDMSKFEPIIGKPGDGPSPHCAIVDEYHEHDTDHMVDSMQTGMGAREQPLLCIITTAGSNLGGPCYEMQQDVQRILEGTVTDETVFGIIYGIDEGDAWDDPESLIKANPNYGISVFPDFLLAQLAQAKRSASKQSAFRTKHLNQWVGAKTAWMNILAWQRQKKPIELDDFAGKQCTVALDLASKVDLASLSILFRDGDRYTAFTECFAPATAVEQNEKYQQLQLDGWLTETPGSATDYGFIEQRLSDLAAQFDLVNMGYDPWQAQYLAQRLQIDGFPIVEYRQTVANMSEPMKELESAVLNGSLTHDGNSALTWCVGNVHARLDEKDNIYPCKDTKGSPNKIDAAVSLIMAFGLWLQEPEATSYLLDDDLAVI